MQRDATGVGRGREIGIASRHRWGANSQGIDAPSCGPSESGLKLLHRRYRLVLVGRILDVVGGVA